MKNVGGGSCVPNTGPEETRGSQVNFSSRREIMLLNAASGLDLRFLLICDPEKNSAARGGETDTRPIQA